MKSFKELTVWQKSMDLVEEIYRIVKFLPSTELYSLSDQIRRAAISIPSNIAEGYGRNTAREYARFLAIARGSKHELETQLLICVRLNYLSEQQVDLSLSLCNEIGRI